MLGDDTGIKDELGRSIYIGDTVACAAGGSTPFIRIGIVYDQRRTPAFKWMSVGHHEYTPYGKTGETITGHDYKFDIGLPQ